MLLCLILRRRYAEFLFKCIAEVVRITVADRFGDHIGFFIFIEQHMHCPVHTDIREVVDKGLSRFPLENGREVRRTDTEKITNALDAQVLIAVMLMHIRLCLRHKGTRAVAA